MQLSTLLHSRSAGFAALFIVVLLSGCEALQGVNVGTGVTLPGGVGVGANKTIGSGQSREKSTSKKAEEETPPTTQQGLVKLYIFDCGTLRTPDVSAFGLSNAETDVRELFVPCYLIEHPTRGRLLWDAGLPASLAGQGEVLSDSGFTQIYRVSLVNQLKNMNLQPDDIDYVAFSHMHFDHVGSANAFSEATLLIQEAEYTAAFVDVADYFDYALYEDLAGSAKQLLNGDFDVFGDGSVQILSAPGHTPGHQVLLVNLENRGPVLLSGDLYHFKESRELRRVPTFNADKAQSLESIDKIETVLSATRASLWIQHNLAQARTLKQAPEYYD
ncbi:MAG: N-acyl homoserine lactonase family protein [Pseudomonadota bacterium]